MSGKILKYVVLVVIAANLAIVAVVFEGGSTPEPMPNPNGYDDFVKAGKMLPLDNNDYAKISADTLPAHKAMLSALVASNSEALKLVRAGLSKECRERVEYSSGFWINDGASILSFKRLAFLIRTEGHVAELEGQSGKAARIYLDGIRYGQELSRGGVIISKQVGIADENIVSRPLSDLLPKCTNPATCHEIAGALETIDAREEPIPKILEQEKRWMKRTFGIRGQIEALIDHKSYKGIEEKFVAKVQTAQATRRHMIIDFAARAYELEKGKPAQSVAELVPDYLTAVPKDPVTGKDMGLGR